MKIQSKAIWKAHKSRRIDSPSSSNDSEGFIRHRKRILSAKLDPRDLLRRTQNSRRSKENRLKMRQFSPRSRRSAIENEFEENRAVCRISPRNQLFLKALLYSSTQLSDFFEQDPQPLVGKKRAFPVDACPSSGSRVSSINEFLRETNSQRSYYYSKIRGNICNYFDNKLEELNKLKRKIVKKEEQPRFEGLEVGEKDRSSFVDLTRKISKSGVVDSAESTEESHTIGEKEDDDWIQATQTPTGTRFSRRIQKKKRLRIEAETSKRQRR